MKNSTNLTLVKGNYTADEAREILMDLFHSKINFHEVKNFSSNERYGKDHEHSIKRIASLRDSIEEFSKLVTLATDENKTVTIESSVVVTFD